MFRRELRRAKGWDELKGKGYDLGRVEKRVEELLGAGVRAIYSRGRTKEQAEARSLFCCWAVRELGVSNTDLARKPGMTQPAVGYAVRRGEALAGDRGFSLEG